MMVGPHCPGGNQPTVSEENAVWIANVMQYVKDKGAKTIETTAEAEKAWVEHVDEVANMTVVPLGRQANSWYTGSNIEGKPQSVIVYLGGANNYYDLCEDVVAKGYQGFLIE
jgi:cyclohexanone monooxygenase